MKRCKMFSCWTDYPMYNLGDRPGKQAQYRQVIVLSFDGNKYATVQEKVSGEVLKIKTGYLYSGKDKFKREYGDNFSNKRVNFRKFQQMINTEVK